MSLEQTKEKLNDVSMRLIANRKSTHGIENQNDMTHIHDNKVKNG